MLAEDKADMVREAVVKSLAIIMGYIDDPDKYTQVRVSGGELIKMLFLYQQLWTDKAPPAALGGLGDPRQFYFYTKLDVESLLAALSFKM